MKLLFFSFIAGWGLKALSIFVTVKIKIILLLLFIGGGIFYGLKIWQGTALGCPEPIIQEVVKNHHDDGLGILPYHGHYGLPDITSYPGSPGDSFGGGYDSYGGVYSNTPGAPAPAFAGPTYLPPTNAYAPPSGAGDSYASAPPSASDASGQTSGGYPYSNRRQTSSGTGRQISEESVTIFGDLMFRFLGVNTDQCRKRFVCELEFRNPVMNYAFRYIG